MDVVLAANQVTTGGRACKWAKAFSRTPNVRENGARGSRERATPFIFGILCPAAGQKRVDRGPSPHQHHPGRRAAAREMAVRRRCADGVDPYPAAAVSRSPPGVDDPRGRGDQHHRRERERAPLEGETGEEGRGVRQSPRHGLRALSQRAPGVGPQALGQMAAAGGIRAGAEIPGSGRRRPAHDLRRIGSASQRCGHMAERQVERRAASGERV